MGPMPTNKAHARLSSPFFCPSTHPAFPNPKHLKSIGFQSEQHVTTLKTSVYIERCVTDM